MRRRELAAVSVARQAREAWPGSPPVINGIAERQENTTPGDMEAGLVEQRPGVEAD
jgi:hypothetical protein